MLCLLLLLPVLSASGEGRQSILLWIEARGGDSQPYSASLAAALSRTGIKTFVQDGLDPSAAEVTAPGCTAELIIHLDLGESRVGGSWALTSIPPDGSAGTKLDSGSIDAPLPEVAALSDFFWNGILASVTKALARLPPPAITRLKIVAPPLTRVTGLGKAQLTIPESGSLEVELASPASYAWKASRVGMEDARGSLTVLGPTGLLSIQLLKAKPFMIELGLYEAAFPDLWVGYVLPGGRLFVGLGASQFFGGVNLSSETSDGKASLFVSDKLLEPGLRFGSYLGPTDGNVLWYAEATASVRISFIDGQDGRVDDMAPFSFFPAAGLELKLSDRFSPFFELGSDLFPFCDGGLMASTWSSAQSILPHLYSDTWFLEFPRFRFGGRWRL